MQPIDDVFFRRQMLGSMEYAENTQLRYKHNVSDTQTKQKGRERKQMVSH